MFGKRMKGQAFTLVELLVVLVIVAILAAVATPLYLKNTQRAKASEAVAAMGIIREEERDYGVNHNTFFDVAGNQIQLPLPSTVDTTTKVPTPAASGFGVALGTTKYFTNDSYSVDASTPDANGASDKLVNPPTVDFLITANGSAATNNPCTAASGLNCSTAGTEVATYQLEMDNSGRVMVCYQNCGTAANWGPY